MSILALELASLYERDPREGDESGYRLAEIKKMAWDWDAIVKGGHPVNCWYNNYCVFNLYVKDGVVLREEQTGSYAPPNDPNVPDLNPRGCQKGACWSHDMYAPTRLKYPLKRVGDRGEGKWQRVSWDEALTEIVDNIIDTLLTEGSQAIILGFGTQGLGSDALSYRSLVSALNIPIGDVQVDIGDVHYGATQTWGKLYVSDSADNWFHADMIFLWGGNPAYTHIANFHYISEARYNGTKVVAITPDYNATAPFADLWVPINIGSDAALALAMAQVIISRGLYKPDFLWEQTDMPLLVRSDTRKFLTQKDVQPGGREDIFYMFDEQSHQLVEAPWKSLALMGLVPSLEGEYNVDTLKGTVAVRPVFEFLKDHLKDYTPERVSQITGVSPRLIEQLAQEFATAKGVVHVACSQFGKHYHGGLIQRAQILLWALCGHFGKKGSAFGAFPLLTPDSRLTYMYRRGADVMLTAGGTDPRFAGWREQGYTDEMIQHEYMVDAYKKSGTANWAILFHCYAGVMDINERADHHLKRPLRDYLNEAVNKGWQPVRPEPKIVLEVGSNLLRRSRATGEIIKNLLPKLRLLVSLDSRMSSTALYSDLVLPVAGFYEKTMFRNLTSEQCPYLHLVSRAVAPLAEAKGDWEVWCLLAKKIEERAKARGVLTFTDHTGNNRRLDNLYDQVTAGGLYTEDDEEAVARDYYLNASNVQQMDWEELKDRGIAPFTSLGKSVENDACDIVPGEPIVPFTWHTDRKQIYPTQTRRMQFYIDHDWYLEFGEAVPVHKAIPKMGGDYPLQVTGGHTRWSIHSVWVDSSIMLRLQRGGPVVWMNPKDAQARDVRDGERVEVFNDVASIRAQAVVAPGVKPGQVIIYHGWENFQFEGKRHFKSLMPSPLNPIELVGDYYHLRPADRYGSQPGGKDRGTRVEIKKASPR